ncbi:MAG TPA: DUF4255 domain-containing protein [Prolixibacteraceae bacterium]|nr:MAG: hypothetical protein A2066_13825 [Bacteroidetes bacterium GWB2_41_8]HCY41478.1 DUF4255 domain-containing protein [Prolixibacteraceae bacterium]
MIYEAIQIISQQLDSYLTAAGLSNLVTLENIALFETSSENTEKLTNKVVLTLLNLEEETTLKNLPNYKVIDKTSTEYRNPPVHLNLFLLISGNCNTYTNSLRSISKTIEFFQGKKVFTSDNTSYEPKEDFDILEHFKLITELYTPTFEELNFVWGTLGGRQLPSVIYKIQLVEIDRKELIGTAKVITEITDVVKHQ